MPMRAVAAAITLALAAGAWAQDKAPSKPDPLGGPRVNGGERVGPATLVQRDFSGKIKRLEVPPEEAALERLNLDQPTREKIQSVLAARAQVLDKIVVDNIDLVVRFANARQAGDKPEQIKLLGEF